MLLRAYPETRSEARPRAVFCARGRVQEQFSDKLLEVEHSGEQTRLDRRVCFFDEGYRLAISGW